MRNASLVLFVALSSGTAFAGTESMRDLGVAVTKAMKGKDARALRKLVMPEHRPRIARERKAFRAAVARTGVPRRDLRDAGTRCTELDDSESSQMRSDVWIGDVLGVCHVALSAGRDTISLTVHGGTRDGAWWFDSIAVSVIPAQTLTGDVMSP